jgi:hypothetical protein
MLQGVVRPDDIKKFIVKVQQVLVHQVGFQTLLATVADLLFRGRDSYRASAKGGKEPHSKAIPTAHIEDAPPLHLQPLDPPQGALLHKLISGERW